LQQYFEKHSPVHPGVEWRISSVPSNLNFNKNYNKNEDKEKKYKHNLGTTYQPLGTTILLPIITWLLTR